MKAKDTSLIGMIVGAVSLSVVFIVSLVKFWVDGTVPNLDQVKGLIFLGIAPSIPFCPVYISTWLDKINEIKNGIKLNESIEEQLDDIR